MSPKTPGSSQERIPFHFHAEGHAFSGEFHRPVPVSIDALAATRLPSIGGRGIARVENFRRDHLVQFTAAQTHVSGHWQNEEVAVTNATTVIENLNILDFIHADRIVARLTAEHRKGEREGHIIALGSAFENLRIAGHKVSVILRHDLFLKCETLDDLRKRLASDKKSGRIAGIEDGAALCSLVEKIETDLPGVDPNKHVFSVPHFGAISLAEVFATQGTRTLTMLKLHLGSPDGANLLAAEVLTNGQPLPPQG